VKLAQQTTNGISLPFLGKHYASKSKQPAFIPVADLGGTGLPQTSLEHRLSLTFKWRYWGVGPNEVDFRLGLEVWYQEPRLTCDPELEAPSPFCDLYTLTRL